MAGYDRLCGLCGLPRLAFAKPFLACDDEQKAFMVFIMTANSANSF